RSRSDDAGCDESMEGFQRPLPADLREVSKAPSTIKPTCPSADLPLRYLPSLARPACDGGTS
ncbi:MAG TPA: hypothetical protein VFO15_10115, partial [Xanthobacteraceae bacterium]|nr:hypothetical protein [Xanthobacteraceae bacterium]